MGGLSQSSAGGHSPFMSDSLKITDFTYFTDRRVREQSKKPPLIAH
jgi:hypothetical protein